MRCSTPGAEGSLDPDGEPKARMLGHLVPDAIRRYGERETLGSLQIRIWSEG